MKCEDCGSEVYLIKKEGTRTIEIIKHYSDCPLLIRIKKQQDER